MQADETLYELGCGDGRLMIAAAKATPGCRCIGVEYDQVFYDRARSAIAEAGLDGVVSVTHGDALEFALDDANAVFVYLVPQGLKLITPRLLDVLQRPGGRIVSYMFSVPGLTPTTCREYKSTKVYLYDATSLGNGPAIAEPISVGDGDGVGGA